MATWIAHLRVAEGLLKKGYDVDKESFIVGNIGPDSGVPNEDWSSFDPPTVITHWKNEAGKIQPEDFYEKYLKDKAGEMDKKEYSFKLGYYTHLIADVEWTKLHERQKENEEYRRKLEEDKNFIWIVKKDWYGHDFIYVENYKESIFHTIFKHIENVPDYLEYFPKGAFTRQVKYIRDYYLGENEETKENFSYLTKKDMDKFIEDTVKVIEERLSVIN